MRAAKKLTEPTGESVVVYQNHGGSTAYVNSDERRKYFVLGGESYSSLILRNQYQAMIASRIVGGKKWDFARTW